MKTLKKVMDQNVHRQVTFSTMKPPAERFRKEPHCNVSEAYQLGRLQAPRLEQADKCSFLVPAHRHPSSLRVLHHPSEQVSMCRVGSITVTYTKRRASPKSSNESKDSNLGLRFGKPADRIEQNEYHVSNSYYASSTPYLRTRRENKGPE